MKNVLTCVALFALLAALPAAAEVSVGFSINNWQQDIELRGRAVTAKNTVLSAELAKKYKLTDTFLLTPTLTLGVGTHHSIPVK
ncbi:hypothetical protein ACFOEE_15615 [Pseudoalteromonas fenneropenaei]|uniref:Uncharacterized protein n=1 Tax=Pseudoalteromonas fenneropenaei TaxID=1737459 RepID=A0ABV7CN47_9GAMM